MADTITSSNNLNLDTTYLDGDTRRIKIDSPKTQTNEAWKTQINDLSDYIATNQLLLGDKGNGVFDKIAKASITQKTTVKLDISSSAPISASPQYVSMLLSEYKDNMGEWIDPVPAIDITLSNAKGNISYVVTDAEGEVPGELTHIFVIDTSTQGLAKIYPDTSEESQIDEALTTMNYKVAFTDGTGNSTFIIVQVVV